MLIFFGQKFWFQYIFGVLCKNNYFGGFEPSINYFGDFCGFFGGSLLILTIFMGYFLKSTTVTVICVLG